MPEFPAFVSDIGGGGETSVTFAATATDGRHSASSRVMSQRQFAVCVCESANCCVCVSVSVCVNDAA